MRNYRPVQSSLLPGATPSTSNRLKRATYYLRPEQIKALKLRAVMGERNLSDVVREAVDQYLERSTKNTQRKLKTGTDDDILRYD